MALAVAEQVRRMTAAEFLAFYEERPEDERWELYDGIPVQMMTPPFLVHQAIAGRLAELLNGALATHDPSRFALAMPGFELLEADQYRPEPDVAVLDADLPSDQRYMNRAYLLAEVVSSTDRERVRGLRRSRIALKRDLYRAHRPCEVVLTIEQPRLEVLLDRKGADGTWREEPLAGPDAVLDLPGFGLRCTLRDLYARTPLVR